MPTREEISIKIRRELAERGVAPSDPLYEFVLDSMEAMNRGMADLDYELADLAGRIAWLAQVPTWINQRPLDQFDAFVDAQLLHCEAALVLVRARWEKYRSEVRSRA